MAVEQYFQEAVSAHELDREEDRSSPLPKWKSISSTDMSTENANGGFDCNICLDFARDPVVTLCGHLYCWPCIYKWLHLQRASPTQEQQQQLCPVCKAVITPTTLVPLYGRSQEPLQTENEGKGSPVIPRRPTACGVHALISATASTTSPPDQNSYYNHSYQDQRRTYYGQEYYPNYGHYTTEVTNLFHPMMGMFGEMIYERLFGSLCPYPNSYYQRVSSSARVRRMEMQADKSLNRVSIFLFCCFLSCLLFF